MTSRGHSQNQGQGQCQRPPKHKQSNKSNDGSQAVDLSQSEPETESQVDKSITSNSEIYSMLFQIKSEMQQTQANSADGLSRITKIGNSVSKLSLIENIVKWVQQDISKLKIENDSLSNKMNEIQKSCESISSFYDELNESRINTEKNIAELLDTNEHDLRQMNKNYDQMQEDFLELKTRSMQENLIFFGID